MSIESFVFNIAGAAVCLLAAAVVIEKRMIYATFGLIGVMIGLSFLYASLGSPFMALVQITLYAGAIMVLFLFVIMLLGPASLTRTKNWGRLSSGILLAAFSGIGVARLGIWAEGVERPMLAGGLAEVQAVGRIFLNEQLAAFELVSLLLVAAMIGVIHFMKKNPS